MSISKIIQIVNIFKKYKNSKDFVLKDVSFSVEKGKIHGLIGPNGAGKTTLLSMFPRFVFPTSGKILINGEDIQTKHDLNMMIGFMSAEPNFGGDHMKVDNYIRECATLMRCSLDDIMSKFKDSSNLYKLKDQKCSSLSTGWKKILQFFVLTLFDFEIFILDEPFNGLDPYFKKLFINRLEKMIIAGKTIILSTHILSDLQILADNITMINKGVIVYDGPKTDNIEKTFEEHYLDKNSEKDDFFK